MKGGVLEFYLNPNLRFFHLLEAIALDICFINPLPYVGQYRLWRAIKRLRSRGWVRTERLRIDRVRVTFTPEGLTTIASLYPDYPWPESAP